MMLSLSLLNNKIDYIYAMVIREHNIPKKLIMIH